MIRRRILPKETSRSLSLGLTLVLAAGLVTGTSAAFNGSTSNRDNTLATASLTAPQALTATVSGTGVALSWSAGSFGGGTGFGHRVMSRNLGVEADPRDGAEGPSATCSASSDTFSTLAGRTDAATTSVTHADAATNVAGSYACYRTDTEFPAAPVASQWYSQNGNPVTVVMLGHVVRSVDSANGGDAGKIDPGDSFTLTFNQPVNIATGPVATDNPSGTPSTGHDVCVDTNAGAILLGRTQIRTNCDADHATTVGRITGLALSPNSEWPGYHATYTWSDCPTAGACKVLTVTMGRRYRGNKTAQLQGAPNPSFEPATTGLTSAAGGVPLCGIANTSTSTCRPVPTGTL